VKLFSKCGVEVVQMRNLSIDSWWYIRRIPKPKGGSLGISNLIGLFKREVAGVRIDYFNNPAPKRKG